MIFLSPPPQVEVLRLCLPVTICTAHMCKAVTCIYHAVLHHDQNLSPHPYLQPGQAMPVAGNGHSWGSASQCTSLRKGGSAARKVAHSL